VYLDIVPFLTGVPRRIGVRVVQEGRDDEPRSEAEQRGKVVVEHEAPTKGLDGIDEERDGGEPCGMRDADVKLVALEDLVALDRPEVAAAIEVDEPRRAHEDHHEAADLVVDVVGAVRIEDLVVVDVARVLVVMVVRQLPRLIWDL